MGEVVDLAEARRRRDAQREEQLFMIAAAIGALAWLWWATWWRR